MTKVMTMKKNKKTEYIQFRIDAKSFEKFKEFSEQIGESMSKQLRNFVKKRIKYSSSLTNLQKYNNSEKL